MNYVFLILLIVLGVCKIQNITNLDKWVTKNNYTLVMFYSDECSHCQKLQSVLEEASEMITVGSPGSIGVPVAQIKGYGLDYYPVMRFYVFGEFEEVQCEWTKKNLETYIDNRVLQYISDTDSEPSLRWVHESYNTSIVAFNETEELRWVKFLKHNIHVTYSSLPQAREILGVGEETTLVMFTEKGINKYTYDGEFNYSKVLKWINDHQRKYYQEFDEEAIQQIFYQRQKNILFIFDEKDKDYREIAKVHQKDFDTVLVKEQNDRLISFLGIKGILHPLAVIYGKNNRKYRLQFKEKQELKQFILNFQNNKLTPYYKSQSPFKNQNWEHQILNIVGEDFPKLDDIFILFYTHWCKESQKAMTQFEELARKYRGKRAFGTFNAQDNEIDDSSIKEIPLLRWYNNKDKRVVTFDGPLTVEAMSEFIEKQNNGRLVNDEL